MPIKRRANKSRRLDEFRVQQLLEGPDACLIAGVGYLTAGTFAAMSPAEQERAMAQMRQDWQIHGPMLKASHPSTPWAETAFRR